MELTDEEWEKLKRRTWFAEEQRVVTRFVDALLARLRDPVPGDPATHAMASRDRGDTPP